MAGINLFLFLFAGYGLGSIVINFLDPLGRLCKSERFIGRLIIGFLGLGFEILFLALLLKDLYWASYIAFFVNIIYANKLIRKDLADFWSESWRCFISWPAAILFALFLIFTGVLFQTIIFDSNGYPQATLIGWGDIAYHLDMIVHLAESHPFVLDQPIANGTPLTYPFMVNLLSAILLNLGLPLSFAWYVPSLIFSFTIFFVIYALGKRLLSRRAWAIALIILVIFGGGLGFVFFLQDIGAAFNQHGWAGVAQIVDNPKFEYTHMDLRTGGKPQSADSPLNIVWITPAISFFSHQRSFALGASLLIFILIGWAVYGRERTEEEIYFWRWLIPLAFLPFIHAHTFLAAAIIFGTLFIRKILIRESIKTWFFAACAIAFIALPQVIFLFQSKIGGAGTGVGMFKLWWGWMTCQHSASWLECDAGIKGTDTNAVWFWTKNFGVIFWGWVAGIYTLVWVRDKASKIISALIPVSLLLFLLPNLVLFQPWEFDNNKVLFYWWLLAIIIMLFVLRFIRQRLPQILILLVILFCGSLAGFVDVSTRVRQTINAIAGSPVMAHAGFYSDAEVVAANWIKANTKPSDAFLTSDGANNFVPMLTGRPIFLGFPGWLWTQGHQETIDRRQTIARQFFQDKNPSALCAMGVRWLIWEQSLLDNYSEAKNGTPAQYGTIAYEQGTPYGQRTIVRLSCLQE